jgi:uncharacterized protein (DUF1778 family)
MKQMDNRDAAYYQSHKDDPEEWGSSEPDPKPTQRLDTVISIRLSADEEAALRREAAKRNQTLSSFIRAAALEQSRSSDPAAARLFYLAVTKTESSFGFELSGRPAVAEAPLPAR